MENNEKEFTPEESLQLISQIISKTRRNIKASSFYFILWGWILVFAALACFAIIKYFIVIEKYDYIKLGAWLAWIIPIFIGMLISRIHSFKTGKQEKAKSQIRSIISILWTVNGITIMIYWFITYMLNYNPTSIILPVIGLSTFLTGYIIKFKPLFYGGLIFWIAGFISVFITNEYQLLLTAFSIIAGYLIPGYMIKYSKD